MARYIDADRLMKKISRMIDFCKKDNKVTGLTALFQVGDAIMDCPTADVQEAKHGKWIKNDCHDIRDTWVSCNLCGHATTVLFAFSKEYNYCPNCGAKMDKESEKNEGDIV